MKELSNGQSIALADIPFYEYAAFTDAIIAAVAKGMRVNAFFGITQRNAVEVFVILSDDDRGRLFAGRSLIEGDSFPSITPRCPQMHLFERELAEQFGLKALGHPWFKPVRYTPSFTGKDAWDRPKGEPILPAVGDFYRIEDEQIHEVAVGPVHAGVIEPGHFRFQCYGEEVYHLEIALGFQHRGVERALIGGPNQRTIHYMETLSGDTTVGHTTSYSQILEALTDQEASPRSQALRGIALELERLANHIGDMGALSGDVGFLPTMSFCGRIRGEVLNMTALLCGNRFGRGLITPGGTGFDMDADRTAELLKRLAINERDALDAINLLWDNQSVMARFEDTGPLQQEQARELGIVGPAARATGLVRDIRFTHPAGIYRFAHIPVATYRSGDVSARAYVRFMEIQRSFAFIRDQLQNLPGHIDEPAGAGKVDSASVKIRLGNLKSKQLAVALNEGWRGEICHVAITDDTGHFVRYKVVDPSFHNWTALAMVLRNQEISDFPLCNKSFNLSYCGHDL
uniref:Hydrogenase n=1 Tax=Gracilinema caldarium TaxID=215591 RepID=A0A7C3HY66_9SPIR